MVDTSRITGLASGMDTESMIQKLMDAESIRKEKLEKEVDYIEWEREAYQDISQMLIDYKSANFDVLSPDTNFRSPTMFADFDTSVTQNGISTNTVEVSGTAKATNLNSTIDSISQLASKDKYQSTSKLKDNIQGTVVNISNINTEITNGNDTFVINMDGTSKSITLDGGYADINALESDLDSKVNAAFGSGKIDFQVNTDSLSVENIEQGHQVKLLESDPNILTELGFENNDSNYIKNTETLADSFGVSGDVNFSINGVSDFGITSTDTLGEMIDKVNQSDAGVTMSYSEISGKINIESDDTGEINKISFTDTDSFLQNSLNIDTTGTSGYTAATDAEFSLNGVATSRSSNNFTVDGINYQLNGTTTDPIDIQLSADSDGLVEKITGFVDKYNEIIKKVNGELSEKRYYDYEPLTADEKKAMSEDEIEMWEGKAKNGILRGSNDLENISNQMRTLIYEPIEGMDITLKDIGITTSSSYKDNGKLIIDEDKLKESIENNYDKVVKLFTKKSDVDYDDTANRAQRTAEEGIANRIYDVLQDNIRNTRDENGNKGLLIEKAGLPGELSELNSSISEELKDYDERIQDMVDYLNDRENYYYRMFARMEKAMSEMQAQSGWIQNQMG